MSGRESSDFDEIKHHVHGDDAVSDEAVRKNAWETSRLLLEMGSPLGFSTSGGQVFKEVRFLPARGNGDVTET